MRFVWLVFSILMAASLGVSAQGFPDRGRQIKLIVPFGAGSSTDVFARSLGLAITEVSGVTVVVDNKPGADGLIGMAAAKAATPDGYSLLMTTSSTHALNEHLIPNLPYDPVADFIPVYGVAQLSHFINVGPSVPFKTAKELIAAAKANPGKYTIAVGSPTAKLAGDLLMKLTGIQLLVVSYKTTADAMLALSKGEVDILSVDSASIRSLYETGRVRALAFTGARRSPSFRNIPTLQEEGVPGYELSGWFATYLPAKTPPVVVSAMRQIIAKATKVQQFVDVRNRNDFAPLDLEGDALAGFQKAESDKWGALIRATSGEKK